MTGKQKNQLEVGKTDSINIFSNFMSILKKTSKEKPIKFWSCLFITIVCVVAFLITLFELYFIPSPFDERITNTINYGIKLFSFSFLAVETIYLYLLSCSIRKDLLRFSLWLVIGGLVSYSIISLYIGIKGILELQSIQSNDFFSYLAAIAAFITAIVSITGQNKAEKRAELTRKESTERYREDSEMTIFFQLLDLYTKQANSILTVMHKNSYLAAFEELDKIAKEFYYLYIIYDFIYNIDSTSITDENQNKTLLLNDISKPCYEKLCHIYNVNNFKDLKEMIIYKPLGVEGKEIKDDVFKISFRRAAISEMKAKIQDNVHNISNWGVLINSKLYEDHKLYEIFYIGKCVGEFMNDLYSSYLGQYFRCIYNTIKIVNEFKNNKIYFEIFLSYLSSSEVSILLFNTLSSHSDVDIVLLLKKHNFFDNIDKNSPLVINRKKNQSKADIICEYLKEYIYYTENCPT